MIATGDKPSCFSIFNDRGKHPVQMFRKLERAEFLVHVADDLTIRLVRMLDVKSFSQLLVIINLPVGDKTRLFPSIRVQRLFPALPRRDDRQSFVHHKRLFVFRVFELVDFIRIRPAVAKAFRQLINPFPVRFRFAF